MLSLLPRRLDGRTVLDAGCGSGRYMIHALRRGAAEVVGVDLSSEMLARARLELGDANPEAAGSGRHRRRRTPELHLIRGRIDALPLKDAWADVTLCALAVGHLPSLARALAELRRVTRTGATILCSDFHPVGESLGWRREFSVAGTRYAVRHRPRRYTTWRRVCARLGLRIVEVLEPRIDPRDIPSGARVEPAALCEPVAIVFCLTRAPA